MHLAHHFGISDPMIGAFENELVEESKKYLNESYVRMNSHISKNPNNT